MADDEVIGIQIDDQAAAPTSLLSTFNQYDIVEVYNPLSKTFRGVVARSIPLNTPETSRDREMRLLYGTDLRNPDRAGRNMRHVQQPIEIESGKTKKLPGDVARVVATQLINELMQREGNTNKLADMIQRIEYEKRVIMNSTKQFDEASVLSVEDRLEKQIADLNKTTDNSTTEVQSEQPFPTETGTSSPQVLNQVDGTDTASAGEAPQPAKRGRPVGSTTTKA